MKVIHPIFIQRLKKITSYKQSPPPGIKADYEKVFAVGTHGEIDDKFAAAILSVELAPRFQKSNLAIKRSWNHLQQSEAASDFFKTYAAFREVTQIYPTTSENWHSGERIPLIHAEEIATDAIVLAFQAHYKSAYQTLREVIEMTLMQIYFYKAKDKSIIGKWGRGEIKTPSRKDMLEAAKRDPLFQIGDGKLGISNRLRRIYKNLDAYVHTRGVPTISMGIVGSNILAFTPDALDRFQALFTSACHLCITFIAIFFPAAIIEVPAFAKFGHLDPIWLPRSDEVKCIRSVLPEIDLNVLEDLATSNPWLQTVRAKVNSLPDLTAAEIEKTYEFVMNSAPEALDDALGQINKLLE